MDAAPDGGGGAAVPPHSLSLRRWCWAWSGCTRRWRSWDTPSCASARCRWRAPTARAAPAPSWPRCFGPPGTGWASTPRRTWCAVNERIAVDGQAISDAALGERLLERARSAPRRPGRSTYFELGTLAALEHFAREQVDVAVLEMGLGGRLDATTAARPALTAITRVGLDHMEYLGETLAAIAAGEGGHPPHAACRWCWRRRRRRRSRRWRPRRRPWGRRCSSRVDDFALEAGHYRGPGGPLDDLRLGLRGGASVAQRRGGHHRRSPPRGAGHVGVAGAAIAPGPLRDPLAGTSGGGAGRPAAPARRGAQRGRRRGPGRGAGRSALGRPADPPGLGGGLRQADRADAADAPPPLCLGGASLRCPPRAAWPRRRSLRSHARSARWWRWSMSPAAGPGRSPRACRRGRLGARCRVAVPGGRGEGAARLRTADDTRRHPFRLARRGTDPRVLLDANASRGAGRAAHGRRARVPRRSTRKSLYEVETPDGWTLVVSRYRAGAPGVPPAAARRAAAPGARLLPEPPHLDQRASSSRTCSTSASTSTSSSCAATGRAARSCSASASAAAGRRPPPDLDYGWDLDSYLLYDLPADGRRGEGGHREAAHLLLRPLHGRDARLRLRRHPRRPRGADHHRRAGGPRSGVPAAAAAGPGLAGHRLGRSTPGWRRSTPSGGRRRRCGGSGRARWP